MQYTWGCAENFLAHCPTLQNQNVCFFNGFLFEPRTYYQ